MLLSDAPAVYNVRDQDELRKAIKAADKLNLKAGRDLNLGSLRDSAGNVIPARLIIQGTDALGAPVAVALTYEMGVPVWTEM